MSIHRPTQLWYAVAPRIENRVVYSFSPFRAVGAQNGGAYLGVWGAAVRGYRLTICNHHIWVCWYWMGNGRFGAWIMGILHCSVQPAPYIWGSWLFFLSIWGPLVPAHLH